MRRRGLGSAVRGLALAGLLAFCGALTAVPALAFEPLSGSKNFTSPGSAPNYFSNEAAPFGQRRSGTQPGADRFNTAPGAAGSGHAAMSPPTHAASAAPAQAPRYAPATACTSARLAARQNAVVTLRHVAVGTARMPVARAAGRHAPHLTRGQLRAIRSQPATALPRAAPATPRTAPGIPAGCPASPSAG